MYIFDRMKYLFIAVLILNSYWLQAQIAVGRSEKGSRLSESSLADIQKTTTVFVLQDRDMRDGETWKQAIASVWTITPFVVAKRSEIGQYLRKPGYSFFILGSKMVERVNRAKMRTTSTSLHLYYDLLIPEFDKDGKLKKRKNGHLIGEDHYARIFLYPTSKTMMYLMANIGKSDGGADRYLHQQGEIYNWAPGMMSGYLDIVNRNLLSRSGVGVYDEVSNEATLGKLKNDTLYIPDYVTIKFNPFSGQEDDDGEQDDESQKKAYKYPVKLISVEELDKLIMNRDREIFYLSYVKNSAQKIVSVYSNKSSVIYTNCTPMSYNFKNKDLAKLAKHIE